MMKVKMYLSLLLIFISIDSWSQPSYIYYGGIGSGHSLHINNGIETFLAKGGNGDGQFFGSIKSNIKYLSQGGDGAGHNTYYLLTAKDFLSLGGVNDGYDMQLRKEKFIWTGAVGTGWNVAGNWNYSTVPDINRPVAIPSGVSNFPSINAGIFAIGNNPNSGAYACESLCVLDGATLTTRPNNKIENFGLITIYGSIQVRNQTASAFQNFETGVVIINDGGELKIKP